MQTCSGVRKSDLVTDDLWPLEKCDQLRATLQTAFRNVGVFLGWPLPLHTHTSITLLLLLATKFLWERSPFQSPLP